jgi:hypothetical protein
MLKSTGNDKAAPDERQYAPIENEQLLLIHLHC